MLFGALDLPRIAMMVLSLGTSTANCSTRANFPPEARTSMPICCVLGTEMASKTYWSGLWVTLLISAESSADPRLRSKTWVAPRYLRKSVCLSDAVVMMGENLESLASWMTGFL